MAVGHYLRSNGKVKQPYDRHAASLKRRTEAKISAWKASQSKSKSK